MNNPKELPALQHDLHEWIEIQVWEQDRHTFIVSGSYSPDGLNRYIHNDAIITSCLTQKEAMEIGMTIAKQASVARLIAGLPFPCNFKEGMP
ncbi:MAG: hypothetical protein ABTQ25_19275 [Nitrosomonas ureae]